jgi:tetratricopeptide (TPR) repeat protein
MLGGSRRYQRRLCGWIFYTPNYPVLEVNMGIVNALNNASEAERHFIRAISLAPEDDQMHFYYGRWLFQIGRATQAIQQLQLATWLPLASNPATASPRPTSPSETHPPHKPWPTKPCVLHPTIPEPPPSSPTPQS